MLGVVNVIRQFE